MTEEIKKTEHNTPEKECLQMILDVSIGYDGCASENGSTGSVKCLCKLIDEIAAYARKGLKGEWPND